MYKALLMNSAIMPKEGNYSCRRITKKEFIDMIKFYHDRSQLISYIGYQNCVDLIKKWTGIEVPINRNKTTINNGDIMIVMRLKYRIDDPKTKSSHHPKDDDYEFFYIGYIK
jgi:hypothetical protein